MFPEYGTDPLQLRAYVQRFTAVYPLSVSCSLPSSWVWHCVEPPLLTICGGLFTTFYLLNCGFFSSTVVWGRTYAYKYRSVCQCVCALRCMKQCNRISQEDISLFAQGICTIKLLQFSMVMIRLLLAKLYYIRIIAHPSPIQKCTISSMRGSRKRSSHK